MLDLKRAWIEVDLDAVSHNYKMLNSILAKNSAMMAVIKADAYGHGAVEIAHHLLSEGVTMLAVSVLDEALELRREGIAAPILVLNYVSPERCDLMVQYGLIPTVYTLEFALALSQEATKQSKRISVHVNVDTGMGRLGVSADVINSFVKSLKELPCLDVEGIYSHLATADEADANFAKQQYQAFLQICDSLEKAGHKLTVRHIINSAALLGAYHFDSDLARVGIALYGLYPSDFIKQKSAVKLRQALQFKTVVSYVKEVPAGIPIGYGRAFITQRPSKIATIPVGYADGYSRLLSNKSHVIIKGFKVPIIGNICMDQFMVDVTTVVDVNVGDEVTLIGEQGDACITIDDIAELLGTINYEVPCMFSKRVPRIYMLNNKVVATKLYVNIS